MTHDFSDQAGKIIDGYLDRLRGLLRGLPETERKSSGSDTMMNQAGWDDL